MSLKKLIFITAFFLSLNTFASSSTEIMTVAEGIKSLQSATQNLSKNSSDRTHMRMWSEINSLLIRISNSYRFTAIQYAVVESKSSIDLRKYRFGNKFANKNNLEEAHSEFLLAWLETDAAVKFITELEKIAQEDVDSLRLIKSRLKSTTEVLQNHANQVLEYASKR